MRAGRMRHRVIVQKPTETRSPKGSPVTTWSAFATLWASMNQYAGNEPTQLAAQKAERSVLFEARYVKGLHAKQRLLVPAETVKLMASMTAAGTTLLISDATAFPSPAESGQGVAYRVRCEDELMVVTAGFGTTSLTVTRGTDGTTASAHNFGVSVSLMEVHDIVAVMDTEGRSREVTIQAVARGTSV
jgi:SPP1 family predicted phage head-tail adaptor